MDRGGGAPATQCTIGIDASRGFCDEPTGTERYATEVVRRLASHPSCAVRLYVRHANVIGTQGLKSTRVTDRGVERQGVRLPSEADVRVLRPRRLWTHIGLAAELAKRPPDVLFVPAHVVPLVCRPPAVVTVHDLGFLAHPEAHPWSRRAYLTWSTRRHARRAAHVVADSMATRDDLISHYGADPARITVSHLGVDGEMRPIDKPSVTGVLVRLGLVLERRYILHVGTLQPRKNLVRLVEAFSRVAAIHPDADLVLAGKPGWGDEDLRRTAARLGLVDRVILLGYVPRPDLPALYSGAAAVVVPSLYEGFGLPALEAMACGAPVAVSGTSSLPEVVGTAGLLFDPLDTGSIAQNLQVLLSDADVCARLSQSGRTRAATFGWDACAERIRRVLFQVVEASGSGGAGVAKR